MKALLRVISSMESLLLPSLCMECEIRIPEGWICPSCRKHLRAAMITPQTLDSSLSELHAIWRYDGAIRLAIERWKYGKMPVLGSILLRESFTPEWLEANLPTTYDAIVPIPPHRYHIRHRGFDPVIQIADHLSLLLHIPVINALARVGVTKPQIASTDSEREQNVKGRFRVKIPQSGSVLIVDDVVTTGSTLHEAARTLKSDDVTWIGAITLASALKVKAT